MSTRQTFRGLGPLRPPLRAAAFKTLEQTLGTDDGRKILADALKGIATPPVVPTLTAVPPEYPELGRAPSGAETNAIFVTGRFRSGSTLLWNIFRHVPACTAYYEPLNERRWFDPSSRGERVDATHVGVDDYWKEYDGLAHIAQWYQEHWIDRHLFMNETFWAPELESYIRALIHAAAERAVLQFNRVDFRLPWLKRTFPGSRIIHLFRHPRDQ